MLPPQSIPLRQPVSPTSSTASDYFTELAASTKAPGPIRPTTGPSRVAQNEAQDPTAPAKHRVVGGARRVLLPDPSLLNKDAPEASTSKPATRPGPSRPTAAPTTSHAARPPVSSSTSTAAKPTSKPPVRSRTESSVKPRVLSASTAANTASNATSTTSRPTKPEPAAPVRTRTISRLTEPTQAQLARAKATAKPAAAKKEVAKPVPFVPTRSTGSKTASTANKGLPAEKDKKKPSSSEMVAVTVRKGKERKEKISTPEREKVVEVAKMIPLPPSPTGDGLVLFPKSYHDEPATERDEAVEADQDAPVSELDVHQHDPEPVTESETETETEMERDVNAQTQVESAMVEPEPEIEEHTALTQPEFTTPSPKTVEQDNHFPSPNNEEEADPAEEEDLDEETFREEAQDTPQGLPRFFLNQHDPNFNPSTPQARRSKSRQSLSQLVPETPISALLSSIQQGFEMSPAPTFDPDQTMTFGGLLPRDRVRTEPLFLGDRKRR